MFKKALDRFLSTIPYEPLIPGYTAYRRAKSNSLLDVISTIRDSQPEIEEEMIGCPEQAANLFATWM